MVETAIDLAPALQDGLGHVVLIVEPVTSLLARRGQTPIVQKWVQATRIGLDAFVDGENMLAWANALTDGAPLPGVKLALLPGDRAASTDAAGVAKLLLPYGPAAAMLTGSLGNDTAILPADPYFWGDGGWARRPATDSLRWYVFDDRGLYRPGEDVHVKGWIRRVGGGPAGDIGPLAGAATQRQLPAARLAGQRNHTRHRRSHQPGRLRSGLHPGREHEPGNRLSGAERDRRLRRGG